MLLPALSFNSSSSGPMRVREWFDRGAVDPPIGSRNGFRAGPVNHAQRRQDASFLP